MNISFVGEVTEEIIPKCDVIVDVTSSEGVTSLISRLDKQKLIVGATGDLPYKELQKYSKKTVVYVVPNFSRGVQMLYPILEQVLSKVDESWKFKIEETHHTEKKDKPSGTAKRLAKVFGDKDVEIISKREGDIVGIHKIFFLNDYEQIEITHRAFSRDLYAAGCLKMIEDIEQKINGYFSF